MRVVRLHAAGLTWRRAGWPVRHRGSAYAQRGLNTQCSGSARSNGTWPGMGVSRLVSELLPGCGTAPSSPVVYG